MTWVRTSDQKHRDEGLRLAGKDAALFWWTVVHESAAVDEGAGSDGLLTPLMLDDSAHLYKLNAKRCGAALVAQGLLHDAVAVKGCLPCMERGGERTGPRDLFIHEWWENLLPAEGKADGVKSDNDRRRKALNRDKALVAKIRRRDRDLCRYCGVETIDSSGPRKNHRLSRQLDHIDPWGDSTEANLAVACKTCNGRKGQHLPGDAGMTLWASGTTAAQIADGTAVPVRGPAGSGARPETAGNLPAAEPAAVRPEADAEPADLPASRERTRDSGPGRNGSGAGPGNGLLVPAVAGSGSGLRSVPPLTDHDDPGDAA